MDSHTSHPTPDSADTEREIRLVTDAMNHGTDTLEPPADLLRGVLVIGHRRRVRARLAQVGAGLGVAALAVGGFLVLEPNRVTTTGPAAPASASASPTGATHGVGPIEVVSRPSSSTSTRPASRSPEQPGWSDDYRRRVAETLRDLLPATIGRVRIIEGASGAFDSVTVEGKVFPLTFSVDRAAGASAERTCAANTPGGQCVADRLPGAVPVVVHVLRRTGGTATGIEASFHLGSSNVRIAVGADEVTDTSAPVEPAQLLAFAGDSRVLQLIREVDQRPVGSASSSSTVSPTS
jgi:hypothetical protein